jgi:NitT/TauT family transport system ATP-binding protein
MRQDRHMNALMPLRKTEADDVVRIDALEKVYQSHDGGTIRALGPISFSVPDGGFLTIVGPSGCGKSTFLKLLSGLIPHSSGTIRLRGKIVDAPQNDIGIVFQSPVLLPWKTAVNNVLLSAKVLGLNMKASRPRAHELLAMVGLAEFGGKYPKELSGGMQQRVAIARALMHDPSLLLMDEPFGALDAMTRETMNLEIRRIWQQSRKTIIFVTHSIPEAVFLGTHVMVLSGRPGTIADFVDVNLPERRELEMMATPQFGALVSRIRARFHAKGKFE